MTDGLQAGCGICAPKWLLYQLQRRLYSSRKPPFHTVKDNRRWFFEEASFGVIMEDTVHKSCWGITVRTVIVFLGLLGVIYLFGGI